MSIPVWREQGFGVKLIFLSLPSVELAIARVESRVLQGGHAIPQETIRRRFHAGMENFNAVYKPLVDAWALYDNAGIDGVYGKGDAIVRVDGVYEAVLVGGREAGISTVSSTLPSTGSELTSSSTLPRTTSDLLWKVVSIAI